ncbi:MAG: YccF domain-containing protein [Coriobacteriia bacterium]|nr:YccF domain-containing protein [Coriobacteriia bacterium]
MKTLGNIIWFIFGGLPMGLSWLFIGALWCITIIGIPIGKQCFKLASIAFFPFKKEVELGGGAPSLLLNILWIVFGGFMLAIEAFLLGILFCITIIGIPFGKQCFKLAKLSLMPFGAEIVHT